MIIYLYIKQHTLTGLKYFGRTISTNPFRYNGSGNYWSNHINKHGKEHIRTLEIWGFDDQNLCTEFALNFSKDNNIVESKEWANMIIEDGCWTSGFMKGADHPMYGTKRPEHSKLMSEKMKGNQLGLTSFLGKSHSEESKMQISMKAKGRNHTLESKRKISNFQKGKILSEETKMKMRKPKPKGHGEKISNFQKGRQKPKIECNICGKTGDKGNMNRWHFPRCHNQMGSSAVVLV